jgi:hypothetical protein
MEIVMRLIDRKDEKYDRLLVIERAPNASPTDTNARWFCRCDCGRTTIAYGQDLQKGKIKSCGCLNASRIFKHGASRSQVYRVWVEMRNRCNNPTNWAYHNYGGRGIKVDPKWNDFSVFITDMGQRPKCATIEREDNNGPYCKENCRWATHKEQHNNKRTNRLLTAFGRTQSVAQWADEIGLPWTTIRGRIEKYGWSVEDAVSRPKQQGIKPL